MDVFALASEDKSSQGISLCRRVIITAYNKENAVMHQLCSMVRS